MQTLSLQTGVFFWKTKKLFFIHIKFNTQKYTINVCVRLWIIENLRGGAEDDTTRVDFENEFVFSVNKYLTIKRYN